MVGASPITASPTTVEDDDSVKIPETEIPWEPETVMPEWEGYPGIKVEVVPGRPVPGEHRWAPIVIVIVDDRLARGITGAQWRLAAGIRTLRGGL
jgi:hypothetical protein